MKKKKHLFYYTPAQRECFRSAYYGYDDLRIRDAAYKRALCASDLRGKHYDLIGFVRMCLEDRKAMCNQCLRFLQGNLHGHLLDWKLLEEELDDQELALFALQIVGAGWNS